MTLSGDVTESDLGAGILLGSGGEGMVYALPDHPGFAYKRYQTSETPNGDALSSLIAVRASMSAADSSVLDRTCAWPIARVVEAGRLLGFVMPQAPVRFSHQIRSGPASGRTILVELQHLIFRNRSPNLDLPVPTDRQTLLRLCLGWAEVVELLHRYDVVAGDLSPSNLLWSTVGGPSVYVIDCDSFRRVGRAPVLRPKQTPDWDDPRLPAGAQTNVNSDRYKLALVVLRCLAGDPRMRPSDAQAANLERDLAELAREAAGEPDARPSAADWVHALRALLGCASGPPGTPRGSQRTDERIQAGDRPVIVLDQSAPSAEPQPRQSAAASPQRPTIDLTPPD